MSSSSSVGGLFDNTWENWTNLIAIAQIIAGVIGIVFSLFILFTRGRTPAGRTDSLARNAAKAYAAQSSCYLVSSCINLVLGIVLLIGNRNNEAVCLWVWIVVMIITVGLKSLGDCIAVCYFGSPFTLCWTILYLLINAAVLYVVYLRLDEISTGKAARG